MCFHCLTTRMCWIHVQNRINTVIVAAQYDIMAAVISSRFFRKTIAVNEKSFYIILQLQLAHFSRKRKLRLDDSHLRKLRLGDSHISHCNKLEFVKAMIGPYLAR